MATLAEMLRGYADKITNLPTEATRFLAGPTSFLDTVTGKMNMPEQRGFAEGFFGLEKPQNQSVLDPRNNQYTEGYDTGEPFGYAAIASPFVAAGANKLSNKAVQAITKNPFATDIGVIDYASKFSPVKMAQELKKNDLNFFSTLDETVNNLPQAKGTGQQYMAQILKSPAVKQEEVLYRGLDKFLEQNPKVTKQEIQDFLHTNPVKLKETVLDDAYQGKQRTDLVEDYRLRDGEVLDDYDYIDSRTDDYLMELKEDLPLRQEVMDDILARNGDEFADYDINPSTAERLEREVDDALYERAYAQAKDEYYSDPYMRYQDDYGGEITGNDSVGYIIRAQDGRDITPQRGIYDFYEAESHLRDNHVEQGNLRWDAEGGPKYADYQTEGPSKNYREILIQLDNNQDIGKTQQVTSLVNERGQIIAQRIGGPSDRMQQTLAANPNYRFKTEFVEAPPKEEFASGHFDEPNILAHMRVNDRMIDGKKSLFIEEIQSDWHQQGRKKGYETQEGRERKAEIRVELNKLSNEAAKLRAQKNVVSVQEEPQIVARLDEVNKETEALRYELGAISDIPDAPYKKNWQEMAVRRAIQMAVDEGYDRVAFTTGAQQAERYNLAKQVNSIDWNPYESRGATKLVNIVPKNGNRIELPLDKDGKVIESIGGQFAGKSIDDIVGKDIAKKIMDTEADELSGAGLSIGGEGMKGFYDKILPEYINKYGKKYGIKVGKTNLPTENNYAAYKKWANAQDPTLKDSFVEYSWDKKDDMYQRYLQSEKKGDEVHYFDITPEAKKSLLEKGSPLFAIPPAVEMTDEESRKEMLERLFKENQK